MRYIPLSDLKRGFVGANWNAKYLRALQRMLIPTQGKGVSSRSFFEADFGKTPEEFVMYLSMPEEHLGWRGHFTRRKNENDSELMTRRQIWEENQQYLSEWRSRFQLLGNTKGEFIDFIGDNNYTIERFCEIENIDHKKLFIHYFTIPTLLKSFMLDSYEDKEVIIEYITKDFPLMFERMIRYVANGKLPYSLLEGAFRTFGAVFVKSVFEHIDFIAEEEPFVINNLLKVQKKAQMHVFKFELIQSFFIYKSCGALRKKDIEEAIKAIKGLDGDTLRGILETRFDKFKKNFIKRATDGEIGTDYVTSQIEQQLNNFCRQISLFELEEFK